MNDQVPFLIYSILGIPLLLQYYSLGMNEDLNKLWTNNGQNYYRGPNKDLLINLHTVSLVLALICGLYVLYFLTYTTDKLNKPLIYSGLLFFIGWSLLWIPTLYSNVNKLVLFGVGLGALLLTIGVKDIGGLPLIACAFLFFHTFVIDFMIWSPLI